MRLDPVFLVQPEPEAPPSGLSRRTLMFGALATGAAGIALGAAVARWWPRGAEARGAVLPAEVRWAMELQSGDPRVLLARHLDFLAIVGSHAGHFEQLRDGVIRLADVALEGSLGDLESRQLATSVCTALEPIDLDDTMREVARQLQLIRR